ncbi:hypothetical protein OIDMADRAFT_16368 [Oidiodendron maius Zn]|uniref:Uncharacterized protein n=1 Tax=Oidiodendron maius (strain Zn) TaxID=913774 RepID=A0A0C3I0A8_OIDMZ|nr:hypothetical protein OIDMADRAFT_16368 [Oidiodendron maius Zn]
MSIHETYRIAHTARCKLQIAADRPDRNLRFILGHAFTLDNLRLQIAQIEQAIDSDSESDEDEPDIPSAPSPGVVSFPKSTNRPVTSSQRRRSPPPHRPAGLSDSDSSQDEDDEYEDDAAEDLRLERFGSAAGLPPRMIDDEGSDEEDELTSPPGTPSQDELRQLTQGGGNDGLTDMYQSVAGCPCQKHSLPTVEKMWDIPQRPEKDAPRLAIVQVAG